MKTPLLIVLILCLASVLVSLVFSLTRRDRVRSLYMTVMSAGVAMYLFGYILEILSPTVDAATVANRVQNVGIPLIGPFFLLFMLAICKYDCVRSWMVYAAYGYAMLMFIMVLTNEYHYLYYRTTEYRVMSDMYYMVLGYGPLFTVQQIISVGCVLAGNAVLILKLPRIGKGALKQMSFIVLGSLLGITVNILYATGAISKEIDPAPISYSVAILFFTISIIRFKMFDIVNIVSETVIRTMDDAVIVLAPDWTYQFSNKSADKIFPGLRKMFGSEPISKVGNWPVELKHLPNEAEVGFSLIGKNGDVEDYRARISSVGTGSSKIGWSITVRNITEMTNLIERMRTLAITDPLTGIYNRRYFMENAQRELEIARRSKTVSTMVIFDLDYFKRINDRYGHQVGDLVLIKTAEVIRAELRSYDIFARYGGEEFSLLAINICGEEAEKFAWRLCRAVEAAEVKYKDHIIRITASFGIVDVCWEDTVEDAVRRADDAMYKAKKKGRNQVAVGSRES